MPKKYCAFGVQVFPLDPGDHKHFSQFGQDETFISGSDRICKAGPYMMWPTSCQSIAEEYAKRWLSISDRSQRYKTSVVRFEWSGRPHP